MGLLDGLLSSLLGGLNSSQQSGITSVISGLITKGGGIEGLVQKFSNQGLGDLVKGWVSTGPNPPATPDQIEKVLGGDQLQQMAAQSGIDRNQIADVIAKMLPQVVNKVTPDGKPVDGPALNQGLASLLQGGLGKLFS